MANKPNIVKVEKVSEKEAKATTIYNEHRVGIRVFGPHGWIASAYGGTFGEVYRTLSKMFEKAHRNG